MTLIKVYDVINRGWWTEWTGSPHITCDVPASGVCYPRCRDSIRWFVAKLLVVHHLVFTSPVELAAGNPNARRYRTLSGEGGHHGLSDILSEKRYELKIGPPKVRVIEINWHQDIFTLQTSAGSYQARVVVGATGSFENPFIPKISGRETFTGKIIHSAQYREPTVFKNQKVGIVGEGNSGAQILSEVSRVADTFWITKDAPDFLPDHVDGRYLFDAASQLFEAKKRGREYIPPSLGHIVMVRLGKGCLALRSMLVHYPSITRFTTNGVELEDHRELPLDSVIFCTGFRPALQIFKNLPVTFRHDKNPHQWHPLTGAAGSVDGRIR